DVIQSFFSFQLRNSDCAIVVLGGFDCIIQGQHLGICQDMNTKKFYELYDNKRHYQSSHEPSTAIALRETPRPPRLSPERCRNEPRRQYRISSIKPALALLPLCRLPRR